MAMHAAVRALLACIAALLLAWPSAAQAAAVERPASDQAVVRLEVAVKVDNVYGFSSRDKTFTVEGTVRVAAPAAVMQPWLAGGVNPITLVRLNNMIRPWDSLVEPISGPLQQGSSLGREYRFHGSFYSDEIDYRGYPFGALPLQLNLTPDPSFPAAIAKPAAIRLVAQQSGSGVSQRTNMSGYRLTDWTYRTTAQGVEMELLYQPISWAALVKWLLPLAITMLVMLLTPNLRSSFTSERVAVPPVILLTLVFMQQAYRDSLPALPYLTVLDGIYAFSYVVTLMFFCEFIWSANLIDQNPNNPYDRTQSPSWMIRRIDRLEIWLQLGSLAGYAVLLGSAWMQR